MLKSNECRVNVLVQYYENYSEVENIPYWKPKGGHTFTFVVDVDTFIYSEDSVIKGIKEVLVGECDNHSRYEYLSHEVMFSEPTDLTDKLKSVMDREEWWEKTHLEELYYESED